MKGIVQELEIEMERLESVIKMINGIRYGCSVLSERLDCDNDFWDLDNSVEILEDVSKKLEFVQKRTNFRLSQMNQNPYF